VPFVAFAMTSRSRRGIVKATIGTPRIVAPGS